MNEKIVLATPHKRYDFLSQLLERTLGQKVIRICSREDLSRQFLDEVQPKYVFFPHWSWKIPEEIFKNFECVIFHMTDLPYGRGGSPLQNLILRGHRQTVLSAIKCVQEMDAGPIYCKRPLSLDGTAEQILERAAELMGDMMVEIVQKNTIPQEQKGAVTIFERRKPSDGNLGGLNDLAKIYDYIRMLDATGYPNAFIQTEKLKLEFSQALLSGDFIEAKVRIQKNV